MGERVAKIARMTGAFFLLLAAIGLSVSCTNPLSERVHTAVEVARGSKIVLVLGSTMLSAGGTQSFGQVYLGSTAKITFIVTNAGKANLVLTNSASAVALSGTDSNQFSVSEAPTLSTIPPGQNATFSVTFAPSSSGTKTADLTIASNDPSTADYSLKVTGVGLNNGKVADPTFDHTDGTYSLDIMVALSCATTGATIYYTTNGNDPTTSSAVYTSPIPVAGNPQYKHIKAKAVKTGLDDSSIVSGEFWISYDAPHVPQNVQATGGNGQVALTWDTATAAEKYYVYYFPGTDVTKSNGTKSQGITATSCTITGLAEGTQYAFRVSAWNSAGGECALSDPVTLAATAVAAPTFNPPAGSYAAATVTINCATSGVTIRYTADGNDPTGSSAVYYAPLQLSGNCTLKAIAYKALHPASQTASAAYTFVPPGAPAISSANPGPTGGQVTVSWGAVPGATSYNLYFHQGTSVSKSDKDGVLTSVTSPHTVSGLSNATQYAFIVTAAGIGGEGVESGVAPATTYAQIVAPLFNPNGGSFVGSQSVTISSATGGASFRYTTDGSTPSATLGTVYSTPFGLTSNTTLKAIAYKTGMADSNVVTSSPFTFLIPTGVAATAQSANSIQVSWNPVSGATSYNLYCKQGTSVSKTIYDQRLTNVNPGHIVNSLWGGTQFAFIVTAVGAGGESAESGTVTTWTFPDPPMPVNATALSETGIQVSWSSVPGATSYSIYWKPGGFVSKGDYAVRLTGLTSPCIVNLPWPGTQYAFIVTAVNSSGESVESGTETAWTCPAAPADVTATAQSETGIRVNWSGVSGATSYNIYYKQGAPVSKILYDQKLTNVNSGYVVNLPQPGTHYFFIVTAVNLGGESVESDTQTAWTFPAAPTGVNAIAQSASSIQVSWNTVAGATSYNIYYRQGPLVSKTSFDQMLGNVGSPYPVNLSQPGTQYSFIVTAVNSSGESVESGTSMAWTCPAAPAGVTATAQSETGIQVSWSGVSGASSYNIYYKQGTSVSKASYDQKLTNVNPGHVVNSLWVGTQYSFIVTAVGAGGESAESGTATTWTLPQVPPGVNAIAQSNADIRVTWNSVPGATSYNLYYQPGSSVSTTNYQNLLTGLLPEPRTVSGLFAGRRYAFIVTAVNSGGEGAASSIATATTATTIMNTMPGPSSVQLDWMPVDNTSSYRVYYKQGLTVSRADFEDSVVSSGTSWTVQPLNSGVQYAFIVTAFVSGEGEGLASPVVTATPLF
jgi:fibronectin type 3 domain-containing protein